MGRPGHDLRRWNSLGAPLVPVAEDDRELKISPASSPMRGPFVGSGPDACASLTCDEGSLSEASDIVQPRVMPVTSAALRLGLQPVPEPRVSTIAPGSVNRLPGTSAIARSHRRAIDGRRVEKKPAGLGCRSYSLGSGLSMLRARRPPRNAKMKDSEYHQLMPLVLQTLGRLRSGGWSRVPVSALDAWFRAHSHLDAVNGPPPASSADLAAIARRFASYQGTPPKPSARASVGECGETEMSRADESEASEEARTPTGASPRFFGFGESIESPAREQTTAPTSVDDLVDRAVARANAFSDAQTRAFGEACAQSRWCAVNKLSGDETFRVRVPRARAEPTRDAPDRAPRHHRQMTSRLSDEGDERVADVPMADRAETTEGEFEATPMEAASKMLFGEHEAPRMIQALSAARARERDARARRDAETPETQSRRGSQPDLRRVGPPLVRPTSCQSWDWNDDGSPRESLTNGGGFPSVRNEGDSFKRVYSLCNLDAGLLRSNDGSRASSRGGSVSGGGNFGVGLASLKEDGGNEGVQNDGDDSVDERLDEILDDSRSKRARLLDTNEGPEGACIPDVVLQKSTDDSLDDGLDDDTGVKRGGPEETRKKTRERLVSSANDDSRVTGRDAKEFASRREAARTRFEAEAAAEPNRGAVARARDAEQARANATRDEERVEFKDENPKASAAADAVVGSAENRKTASAHLTRTGRVSRESEDSSAMQELRREWASMRGVPARSASVGRDLSLDTGSGPSGDGNGSGASGATRNDAGVGGGGRSVKSASHGRAQRSSTPSIKQRLAEALTPTRSNGGPLTFSWRFNARVTGLNLSNASIGKEGAAFLAEALRPRRNGDGSYSHNTSLRSLNLEFNNLGCEGVSLIAEALKPVWVPSSLPNETNGDAMISAGADFRGRWVANDALERLNLNFCEVGARGAAALASALAPRLSDGDSGRWRHYGGLTHLSLFHNRLGVEGARALAAALAPRAQPNISNAENTPNPLDDFAFHPSLRSLNVGRNQLGDVGLARIARAFAPVRLRDGSWMYNPTFKHLHANANSCLSQEGPLALSESLAPRQNPDQKWAFAATLSTIHLANVLLGEEGGRAVADVFCPRRCENDNWTFPSNLRVLNLSKTGLGDGGAKYVADALRPRREPDGRWVHNPRLRDLHLGGATIGVEGANALANAIKPRRNGSAGVAGLDDDDALEDVPGPWGRGSLRAPGYRAPRWTFNVSLQVLDLRDNVLGPEGVAALASVVAPVLDEDDKDSGSEAEEFEATEDTNAFRNANGRRVSTSSAMETDFGSPATETRSSDLATTNTLQVPDDDESNGLKTEKPKRWLFGGALAVLNLEFNDAGAEGVGALANALAPRWCFGPRKTRRDGYPHGQSNSSAENASVGAFSFGRVPNGNGSGNTNGTSLPGSNTTSRPTSARVLPFDSRSLSRDIGSLSPGSSLAGSPAATPRAGTPRAGPNTSGDVSALCGLYGTRSNPGSLPGSAPGSRPQSAKLKSPLANASGKDEKTKPNKDEYDPDPFSCLSASVQNGSGGNATTTQVSDAHWAANESLRALGIGGNRAGDEGANALAKAVKPRRNPDGTWTATALVKLDASENAIGAEGLFALAEAIDPKRNLHSKDASQGYSPNVETKCAHCGRPSRATGSREGSASSSRPSSARDAWKSSSLCECASRAAAPAAALARSFAATSVTAGPNSVGFGNGLKEDVARIDVASLSPRGVVGSGVSSGGATPSPGNEPAPLLFPQTDRYETYDVHSGLRKLDLARNNSDENVRERFNELREKLRRAPSGPVCDVSI